MGHRPTTWPCFPVPKCEQMRVARAAGARFELALACRDAMQKYPARREEYRRKAIWALRKFIELAPRQGLGQYVPLARQMLRGLGVR